METFVSLTFFTTFLKKKCAKEMEVIFLKKCAVSFWFKTPTSAFVQNLIMIVATLSS